MIFEAVFANCVPTASNCVPGRGSRTSVELRPVPRLPGGDADAVRGTRYNEDQDHYLELRPDAVPLR